MFDYIKYTEVQGKKGTHDIEVYALSTCGFCKRALAFLKTEALTHRYVHIDTIDFDLKMRAKDELREKFGLPVSYPFAIIDGKTPLVGFTEEDWRRVLIDNSTEGSDNA